MAEVQYAERLFSKLKKLAERAGTDEQEVVVKVGYTAAYALYVHENMEIFPPGMRLRGLPRGSRMYRDKDGIVRVSQSMLTSGKAGFKKRGYYWDPQGRARPKFLEEPTRALMPELSQMIATALKRGKTLAQALLAAGLRLLRESMKLVPVDTGNLKNSAFTRLEKGTVAQGDSGE